MDINNILDWVKRHKFATFLIILLLLFVFTIFRPFPTITPERSYEETYDSYEFGMGAPLGGERPFSFDLHLFDQEISRDTYDTESVSHELEIREARLKVESDDAEDDFEVLQDITRERDGYIETSKKTETSTRLIYTATVRVPVEYFEDFIEDSESAFEIEDFEVNNYRIDVQRQIDEIDVLNRAIQDYESLRDETLELESGEERINLLARLTSEMQSIARQRMALERDLGGKEKKADLATINFTFEETLRAELWPDDLGDLFHERIHEAIDDIALAGVSVLTNSLVLLVKVIEYIVYAIVIVVPVRFAWIIGSKLVNKNNKNKGGDES